MSGHVIQANQLRPPNPPAPGPAAARTRAGRHAYRAGLAAEDLAAAALVADGWTILARRVRTRAGEIDIAAQRDGLLAVVEVKRRATLAMAAFSVAAQQQARLLAATECLLADHPDWGAAGTRIDLLLVDAAGRVRRIRDAIRREH